MGVVDEQGHAVGARLGSQEAEQTCADVERVGVDGPLPRSSVGLNSWSSSP